MYKCAAIVLTNVSSCVGLLLLDIDQISWKQLQAKLTAEHIEKLQGMAAQCKAKEGATDDDINSMNGT